MEIGKDDSHALWLSIKLCISALPLGCLRTTMAMNSNTKCATATLGRKNTGTGSNVKSRLPSSSSSHGKRSNFSCQSHTGSSSACSHGVSQSNFSSASFSSGFVSGSYGRRLSSGGFLGSSYGGYSQLGCGNGFIDVGGGIVGSFVGGMGGDPGACGVVFSSVDGKAIMQNLNDRLANYIDKVRCLEAENAAVETKIKDFLAQHGPIGESKDYSHYYRQIEELKKQVGASSFHHIPNSPILCMQIYEDKGFVLIFKILDFIFGVPCY